MSLNPIENATEQVDKVTTKDDLWKLVAKCLIGLVAVMGYVVYYQDQKYEKLVIQCGKDVRYEREKTDTLARYFRNFLLKERENDIIDKRAWQEAQKRNADD